MRRVGKLVILILLIAATSMAEYHDAKEIVTEMKEIKELLTLNNNELLRTKEELLARDFSIQLLEDEMNKKVTQLEKEIKLRDFYKRTRNEFDTKQSKRQYNF